MAAHEYTIMPVESGHVEHVAEFMRAADRAELAAISNRPHTLSLAASVACSTHAYAGMVDGEPICIFGVGPESLLAGRGIVWMLGTDGIERHAGAFLRRSRKVIASLRSVYPVMTNYVDCRNAKAIAWLQWLGFRMDVPAPYGVAGLPFMRFSIGEKLCAS